MIAVENLSFSYPGADILKDVSFTARSGEFVGILGNNGAGKSTLITCLNKIRTPKSGAVLVQGKDILQMSRLEAAKTVAYVAQKNEISQMTVFDSVLLGRKPYIKWSVSREDVDICHQMLERVGMASFKLRYLHALSGGELQKVMLARALVQEPKLLLLDEPTSSLDPKNQHEMMALVQELVRQKEITALIVIHDLNLALGYCDRFLFLREGRVFRYGGDEIITSQTISEVYGTTATVAEVMGRRVVVF